MMPFLAPCIVVIAFYYVIQDNLVSHNREIGMVPATVLSLPLIYTIYMLNGNISSCHHSCQLNTSLCDSNFVNFDHLYKYRFWIPVSWISIFVQPCMIAKGSFSWTRSWCSTPFITSVVTKILLFPGVTWSIMVKHSPEKVYTLMGSIYMCNFPSLADIVQCITLNLENSELQLCFSALANQEFYWILRNLLLSLIGKYEVWEN